MMRLLFLQNLLLCYVNLQVYGQDAIVRGRVYDSETGESLPAATILYKKGQGTITDEDGNYLFTTSAGQTSITFRFLGYKARDYLIRLQAGDTLVLNVGMQTEVSQMNQIVVSAARAMQRISETTVSAKIIRPESIYAALITNPAELMNRTPGIEVLDGQASIRGGSGFSYGAGSRILALVEGLPALTPDAGSIKWSMLPMENISQIEVIKGASSVLYGSSALNGIINFRLAKPTKEARTGFFTESGIYDNPPRKAWKWWDSPRLFASASFYHRKKYNNTGISIGSYLLTDNGYRRLNDQHLGRINFRLTHQPVERMELGFGINAGLSHKRDFLLWEDAWQGALKQSPETENLLNSTYFTLDPFYSYSPGTKTTHDIRMRFQLTDNDFPEQSQNNSRGYSLYAEYQLTYSFSEKVNLASGFTGSYSKVESNLYGHHYSWNTAAYSQLEISLARNLNYIAGLRLEHNIMDKQQGDLVPLFRTGINYQLDDLTFLRASFGQGYRYPSFAEKYAATTLGFVQIFPNPLISPESGWGVEAALKRGFIFDYFDGMLDVAFFYNQNLDLLEFVFGIYQNPSTGMMDFGFRATNVEHSRVYGSEVELGLNCNTGRIKNTLSAGYVFMYPVEFNPQTNENTGEYLKFRRKHSANLNLNSTYQRWYINLNMVARSGILDVDNIFLNELTRELILPGFYDYWQNHNDGHLVTDLSAGYRISSTYQVSFSIKNLFNTEYMGRPGDIQPHRSFIIRLSGNWQ